MPVFPASLVIEAMAQTAGILVGHANDFSEKVILAKINRARFQAVAGPGQTLRLDASIDRLDVSGASTRGTVSRIDPANGSQLALAEIDLMFSHVDHNRTGIAFPSHNFVFTDQFMDLIAQYRQGSDER